MARAGADLVVVMGRAHEATIRKVVEAGKKCDIKVMGDNLAADDRVANAVWMESLGVDFIVHHIGFDERGLIKGLSRSTSWTTSSARCRFRCSGGGPVDRAGDRVPVARRAAGRARRAAGDRRRGVPPGRPRAVPGPAANLPEIKSRRPGQRPGPTAVMRTDNLQARDGCPNAVGPGLQTRPTAM